MSFLAKLSGKSATSSTTMTNQTLSLKADYSGVQVNANPNTCCQAARDIAGQRFLTKNAPMLPLDGCDADACTCGYQRFDERRADARRLSDVGFDMASQLHENDNRGLASSGRREDD